MKRGEKKEKTYIIGVDEVGRGPLAGPVTVGMVMCEAGLYRKLKRDKRLPPLGKDSKKLTPAEREKYATFLKKSAQSKMSRVTLDNSFPEVTPRGISYTVIHISNKIIDSKGISFAIRKAMERCFKNLNIQNYLEIKGAKRTLMPQVILGRKITKLKIMLDGGLKVPSAFTNQKTIIKGDEKEKIIAWASILAKVSRDALMIRAAKKFPKYAFETHKGYGTAAHRAMIRKNGLSVIHRKTFCGNILENK